MKLMTYNVHSGKDMYGKLDLESIAKVIQSVDPDICVLNEVRVGCPQCGNIDQSEFYAERTGMQARFAKAIDLKAGVYGIALLSKYPIKSFEVIKVPEVPVEKRVGYYEDRVIEKAEIDTPYGAYTVFGSHFGLSEAEQKNAVDKVLDEVKKATSRTVLMGDFNITPDNAQIKRISEALVDTDPTHELTFPAEKPYETIDYIFVSSDIKAIKAYTIDTLASDHLPRITEIDA